jgi:hypothetical protein
VGRPERIKPSEEGQQGSMGQPRREPLRPHEHPVPEPEPVDRAKVRALLETAAADRNGGITMHQHPALIELGDLCGLMAYYAFAFLPDYRPLVKADLDELEERIVLNSGAWLSQ